ncbi:MMPL family transporter [Streptomyces sp. NBC_00572]|uniref:MMPL family transporter n=1 Tax=Streptomyces sp. NBC_00572 TaxID=2903664 RepID=UPI002258CA60|nr:MMPL family transporter [Streptomyces sp. NBC_00572]MCX4983364.1 MMPL family transporter [Streptomyces sp. NBC_00572]
MSTEQTVRSREFALRHRVAVGVAWLLVLLLGGVVAVLGLGRLDQSFTASGGPGHRANQAIQERYGNGAAVAPLVAVATWPAATDVRAPETAGRFASVVERAAGPGARTVSYTGTGDEGFLGADGRTVYALVYPGAGEPDLAGLTAVEEAAGTLRTGLRSALPEARVEVTGVLPLQHDSAVAGPGTVALAVKAACAIGLLVLLVLAFRSPLGALAPLLLAGVTAVGALVLVEAVAGFTEISFIVVYLVPVTALVLAVHRWAQPPETGARPAVAAGAAGAAACVALAFFPAAFLRSVGIAGLAVWVVGTAAALTLAPVLRSMAPRPRIGRAPVARPARRPFAAVGLALLVLLAGAATQLRVGNPEAHALVSSGPARDGLDRLTAAGVPSGVLNPLEVLVPEGADAEAVAARAARVPGVLLAAAPPAADWRRAGSAVVVVVPAEEPMTAAGAATVTALRSALAGETNAPGEANAPGGTRAPTLVGGSGVVDRDLVEGVYGLLLYAVPAAALAAFGVLAALTAAGAAFRAVIGALLAAAASAGALTVLWQWGPPDTGAVTGWVPLVVCAFAFCVSLDRSVASAAGGPSGAGPVAARVGALAVLAVGIGPQVELALLVSGFAMAAVLDAPAGRYRARPALSALPVPRSSPRLV